MVDKRFQPPLSDQRVKQDPCGNHPNWAMMGDRTREPRYADIIIIIIIKVQLTKNEQMPFWDTWEDLTIWLRG
jgi:hypothetical protein